MADPIDTTAFRFAVYPDLVFIVSLDNQRFSIDTHRGVGPKVGNTAMSRNVIPMPDDEPAYPPNTTRFTLRTLPGYTFIASLSLSDLDRPPMPGGNRTVEPKHTMTL